MTCKLCRGLGIVYGNPLTGIVCPACGGTGMARSGVGGTYRYGSNLTTTGMARAAVSTPAEKTLLDEFAMAAMAAIVSKAPYDITPLCEVEGKISRICDGAYDYATAMMRERNRRDEMGNVKEDTEQ